MNCRTNTIYLIKSTESTKCYVGQTWTAISNRFAVHKRCATINKGGCLKLRYAMRKYGISTFSIEAIASCSTQEEADLLEDYFIVSKNSIDSGFNLKRGGAHGPFSEESKKRMSDSKIGSNNNRYGITGIQHPMFGKHHTIESKKKISEASKNQVSLPLSEVQLDRLRTLSKANAKLDLSKAEEIRNLIRQGTKHKDIANLYGISRETVSLISRNRIWKLS